MRIFKTILSVSWFTRIIFHHLFLCLNTCWLAKKKKPRSLAFMCILVCLKNSMTLIQDKKLVAWITSSFFYWYVKWTFYKLLDVVSHQVLGSLVTNVGSGVSYIVSSALETMALLASKYAQELIPLSSHISGTVFVLHSCAF